MTPALDPPARLFDAYAIDLDGTVYLDETALPGAIDAIAATAILAGRSRS